MSQILLINGIFNIILCMLFLFYTNKYRFIMPRFRIMLYSSFALYFLFIGFLRIRIAIGTEWTFKDEYSVGYITNIINTITSFFIVIFLFFSVKFRGKIIKENKDD